MPKDASTTWGTTIVQQNRVLSSAAQMWSIEHVGSAGGTAIWRFRNRHSNRCIHPSDWSGLNGTRLLQATCSDKPEAKWYRYEHAAGTKLSFQSVLTGKVMDISHSSPSSAGANAVQYDDYGSPSQRWRLEYAGDF
jgi:Ricin-type beta-trefoil lectin domain-like